MPDILLDDVPRSATQNSSFIVRVVNLDDKNSVDWELDATPSGGFTSLPAKGTKLSPGTDVDVTVTPNKPGPFKFKLTNTSGGGVASSSVDTVVYPQELLEFVELLEDLDVLKF